MKKLILKSEIDRQIDTEKEREGEGERGDREREKGKERDKRRQKEKDNRTIFPAPIYRNEYEALSEIEREDRIEKERDRGGQRQRQVVSCGLEREGEKGLRKK